MRAIRLLFLIGAIADAPSTHLDQPQTPTQIWSKVTLHDLTGARNLSSPKLIDPNRAGISFLDDHRLLVHEVVLDTGQLSSRASPGVSSAFRLDVSVLDTSSGTLIDAKEWGTRPHESFLQAISGGVVLRTGASLRFLAEDLHEVQQVQLPHPVAYEGWDVRISPSGKTVLLNHHTRNRGTKSDLSRFEVFDGGTFSSERTWTESPALSGDSYTISDTAIADVERRHSPEHIVLSSFGSKVWKKAWDQPEEGCLGQVTFVTQDRLAYACKGFWLVSTDGKVLMNDRFQKGEKIGLHTKFALPHDGNSLALSLENERDFWDTGGRLIAIRIAVYNLSSQKRVMVFNVNPLPTTDFDFALSPNGSKLAVLNDRDVSVYAVPTD